MSRFNPFVCAAIVCMASSAHFIQADAAKVTKYTTVDGRPWSESVVKLSNKPVSDNLIMVDISSEGTPLKAWGTTFNELDWDAFLTLTQG